MTDEVSHVGDFATRAWLEESSTRNMQILTDYVPAFYGINLIILKLPTLNNNCTTPFVMINTDCPDQNFTGPKMNVFVQSQTTAVCIFHIRSNSARIWAESSTSAMMEFGRIEYAFIRTLCIRKDS